MRRSGVHRRRLVVAVLSVFVVGIATAMYAAGRALVVRESMTNADALLVLGSHEWERLPLAARLASEQPTAAVWLTQPKKVTVSNCHRCSERVKWLEELGTAAERVTVLPRRVSNTFDEALAARDYAAMHPIRRLLVITSPYHTRRALAVVKKAFEGTKVSVGVGFEESAAAPGDWWRHPYDRAYVAYEWAAIAWYSVRHGVRPWSLHESGTPQTVSAL